MFVLTASHSTSQLSQKLKTTYKASTSKVKLCVCVCVRETAEVLCFTC